MMVHLCDGGSACRREAEDVNANPSCEITGSGAQSCKYEGLAIASTGTRTEFYHTAFGEKVSHDPPLTSLQLFPSPRADNHGMITSKAIKLLRIVLAF